MSDDEQTFRSVCHCIQADGISDAAAALLAGRDDVWLAAYLRCHPGAEFELKRAHAGWERDRRAQICAADKKDGSDWRAHAWLLEHTPAVEVNHKTEADQEFDENELKPNFQITPAHLRALHKARAEQLAALEPKTPALT
jgi:hypothetical protein